MNLNRYENWGETKNWNRPKNKRTRPRTKERPSFDQAHTARVISVDRGRWNTVLIDSEKPDVVRAIRARNLSSTAIVPGDLVALNGDISGKKDTLARIVRLEPRSSFLRRSADDDDSTERALVANVDQMVIVTALANPEPRGGMIDRCLVAAYVAGIKPLLCLTKSDLKDPTDFLTSYAPLGLDYVVTKTNADGSISGLAQLRTELENKISVLIGHSGVGKSTLINQLVPGTQRATGEVNAVTGRGRHTSSSALALRLPHSQDWVIDTPGVRSFGLGHIQAEQLDSAFSDLTPLMANCPRGCTHLDDQPFCTLDSQVQAGAAGSAGRARLASYRRLKQALINNDPWQM